MLLWNIWHTRLAILAGESPFWTDLWFHPRGISLVVHALGLPNAVIGFLLWPFMSPIAVYNTILLGTFVFAGLAMYALLREVGANWIGALIGGLLFTFCPYHLGHSVCHLDLASIQWIALWLWLWARSRNPGRKWAAIGAGAMLAISVYAHFYFGPIAILIALGFGVTCFIGWRGTSSRTWLVRSALMCCVALLVFLPLGLAVEQELSAGDYPPGHDAGFYCVDFQGLFLPGQLQWFASPDGAHSHWSATRDENMAYIGYAALLLATICTYKFRYMIPLLVIGFLGILLAMGPSLHVGGRITELSLPYSRLQAWPILNGMGVPARFILVTYLAISICAGLGASHLWSGCVRNKVFSILLGVIALVEYWPGRFVTSTFPRLPAPIISEIHRNGGAVLDVSKDMQALWNQLQHGAPIPGGNPSRRSAEAADWNASHGVAYQMRREWKQPLTERLAEVDFDWNWSEYGPVPIIDGEYWKGTYCCSFTEPGGGHWAFGLQADDRAQLYVDDVLLIASAGMPPNETFTETYASPGSHLLTVRFEEDGGYASLRVRVRRPGGRWEIMRGPCEATYEYRPITLAEVEREMSSLNVRSVLVPVERAEFFETLGLIRTVQAGPFALLELPVQQRASPSSSLDLATGVPIGQVRTVQSQ